MWIILLVIMVFGYTFLEFYYRSQNAKVTWIDRILGGIGGIILVFSAQHVLNLRGDELESFGSYMFVIATVIPSVILIAAAWLGITRRQ